MNGSVEEVAVAINRFQGASEVPLLVATDGESGLDPALTAYPVSHGHRPWAPPVTTPCFSAWALKPPGR